MMRRCYDADMKTDDQVRTTLALDAEILGAARRIAAAQAQSLGRVVSDLARQGLKSTLKSSSRRGFPLFAIPPNALPLTLAEVKQDEDEA